MSQLWEETKRWNDRALLRWTQKKKESSKNVVVVHEGRGVLSTPDKWIYE